MAQEKILKDDEIVLNLGGLGERRRRPATGARAQPGGGVDLVCLSHLRWDFVYQRPQHLLSRCARGRRVFFVEEPVYGDAMRLDVSEREGGVRVVVPHLPHQARADGEALQRTLLDQLFAAQAVGDHVLWYYTPMPVAWTRHLDPLAVVYDCMDELSAFRGAPPELRGREEELFRRADLVFTGGRSLYEVKREQHPSVHAFPSSIDREHFARAREIDGDPADQAAIPHPRLGFFGVVDERLDIGLLDAVAAARPEWQMVIVGPVVKIDPEALPRRPNIHYLGPKQYKELPAYIAGWDVATLLFALNDSTRFISPTKTPEYLAAGKPVVSTPIRDVVRPYGEMGLVSIAATPEEFVAASEAALAGAGAEARVRAADEFLSQTSWDETWARMWGLIEGVISSRRARVRPEQGLAMAAAQA
ncbi:MAG TPA: glycosyltransferase family 1 protein [Pyrinomonadaceae bacterium]|nr:glycosyltransferase family 1 protein [Pyrinomonadaceae bacterium]